jgi:alpha-ribazole phosphatase
LSTPRRIYLVRHAATLWNTEGRFQGHTDVPLSPEGEEQARKLGERLSGVTLHRVISSDLLRAAQTADAVALHHAISVETHPALREQRLGQWEGLTVDEITASGQGEHLAAYRRDSHAAPPPGAETLLELYDRAVSMWEILKSAGGDIAVVGHTGSIRALVCHVLGSGPAGMRRIRLDNTGVTLVELRNGRPWVALMNCTLHLHMP